MGVRIKSFWVPKELVSSSVDVINSCWRHLCLKVAIVNWGIIKYQESFTWSYMNNSPIFQSMSFLGYKKIFESTTKYQFEVSKHSINCKSCSEWSKNKSSRKGCLCQLSTNVNLFTGSLQNVKKSFIIDTFSFLLRLLLNSQSIYQNL